jgi:hypothetical protein
MACIKCRAIKLWPRTRSHPAIQLRHYTNSGFRGSPVWLLHLNRLYLSHLSDYPVISESPIRFRFQALAARA